MSLQTLKERVDSNEGLVFYHELLMSALAISVSHTALTTKETRIYQMTCRDDATPQPIGHNPEGIRADVAFIADNPGEVVLIMEEQRDDGTWKELARFNIQFDPNKEYRKNSGGNIMFDRSITSTADRISHLAFNYYIDRGGVAA